MRGAARAPCATCSPQGQRQKWVQTHTIEKLRRAVTVVLLPLTFPITASGIGSLMLIAVVLMRELQINILIWIASAQIRASAAQGFA